MTIAHFDCFSGASGDMILGALIDAGADPSAVQEGLSLLNVAGCEFQSAKIVKQGLAATKITVAAEEQGHHPHRSLPTIREIIEGGDLPDGIARQAMKIFERLAEAEANVHGCSIEDVHFHEVGAVDAITDIVGAVLALDNLGIQRITCSAIAVGSGTVKCAHGVLPVPAPATAVLLKGVPLASCDEDGELCTPTGAAILTTLAEEFGPLPPMSIAQIGYGAGNRDNQNRPNVLRVIVGEAKNRDSSDEIAVLETNLDDVTPEVVGYCLERLLEAGALDAYCTPIYMKKSRAAMQLTILSELADVKKLEAIVFTETPTLGIRRHEARRTKLDRSIERVETPYGSIGVKIGRRADTILTTSPEYEDCRKAAANHKVALRAVIESALRSWWNRHG